jgi:predicted ArsR family transcriptional regulator
MPFHFQRFKNSLLNYADNCQQEQILHDLPPYDTLTTPVQTARWIQNMVDHLTDVVGEEAAREVMEACGQQCIGQSLLIKAKKIHTESRDLDDLLSRLNEAHIGGGNLYRDGDVIHASYARCYCGSVSKTRHPISTNYCECSCGWYRNLFETLLDQPVKIELVDSIIHGADTCQFIIHI